MEYRKISPKPFKMEYSRKEQFVIQSFVWEKQADKVSLGKTRTGLFLKYPCGFHRAVGFAPTLVSLELLSPLAGGNCPWHGCSLDCALAGWETAIWPRQEGAGEQANSGANIWAAGQGLGSSPEPILMRSRDGSTEIQGSASPWIAECCSARALHPKGTDPRPMAKPRLTAAVQWTLWVFS